MDSQNIKDQLKQPFDIEAISWKINNYSGDKKKAMITFHVDARAVQDRLNTILGIENWTFRFTELEQDKGVHGILKAIINDKEIVREDVGYANDSDKKEWYKDAVSDALKRCAVHLGVGHFLYSLPSLWIELKEPAQKFLKADQDENIRNWIKKEIAKITPVKPIQVIPLSEVFDAIKKATSIEELTDIYNSNIYYKDNDGFKEKLTQKKESLKKPAFSENDLGKESEDENVEVKEVTQEERLNQIIAFIRDAKDTQAFHKRDASIMLKDKRFWDMPEFQKARKAKATLLGAILKS